MWLEGCRSDELAFTIPLDRADGSAPSHGPPPLALAPATERGASGRTEQRRSVLVAEDSIPIQRLLTAALTKHGYHVDLVANGRQALDAIAAKRYDVVLMDVEMPELDGVAATERLRVSGRREPVVGLTAHAGDEGRARCLEAGMNGFLSKPFKLRELIEVVERWHDAISEAQ